VSDVADLYRGRLDDFIARRDAMAKGLRGAGDKAGADRIKGLRKPSRIAWALDVASSTSHYGDLVTAVNATVAAQSKGRDVRDAMTSLREAVRAFASAATDEARELGQSLDRTAVVNAVFAVIGSAESFRALQRGELAEIPEAGGLDALATITTPALTVSARTPRKQQGAERDASRNPRKQHEEALARAERQLFELRTITDQALRALNAADAELETAERRLEEAANAADAIRKRREKAADATEQAMQRVREAEEKVEQQRALLESS
jgi:hypothetical protein